MLPNLEIFANAGYPFTRKADLAGDKGACEQALAEVGRAIGP